MEKKNLSERKEETEMCYGKRRWEMWLDWEQTENMAGKPSGVQTVLAVENL